MIINTNFAALNTLRQLGNNEKATQSSLAKLSSGLRINSAADDAAGLAISEKMRGQITGLNKASSNAQDGISMAATAEGSLNETTSILQRMRELAVQGANDTNTTTDREAIQTEMNQLTSEINRIGNTTEFNTQKLLKGITSPVVATDQTVTTETAGITGVPVGDTTDLIVNAKSVVAVSSTASVQGNTADATGKMGLTDQTTVSIKGANSAIVISGLSFTSTTLSSSVPNGATININQLANATGTNNTITTSGTGASAVINFNIGTDAGGKSLFTGTNRGELANFLTSIAGYATSGVTISVPEDPNANGPASAESLINMPDSTQVATAASIYTGALTGGVTEQRGVSTFKIASAIKEGGDTITVGGKTFTAKEAGGVTAQVANAANGEFNMSAVNSYIQSAVTVTAAQTIPAAGLVQLTDFATISVGATAFTIDANAFMAYGSGATKTNDDLIALVKNADSAGVKLSTVADVSIGTDNKLQIIAKTANTGNNVTVTVTGTSVIAMNAILGFSSASAATNATTLAGALTGATAADQARSLRVAINANSTVSAHYTATSTANTGEIAIVENATKADATALATVTTAGGGADDKLNITDLSGKNLSQVTIVKGTGVAITGANALTTTVDASMRITSGTKSAELDGVKVAFSGLTMAASGTNTSTLTATWDAANQTLNVSGSYGYSETAANFVTELQAATRTALSAAGFTGGAALSITAGFSSSNADSGIGTALNGKSMTFGGLSVTSVAAIDGTFGITSGVMGTEFGGVKIAFTGLATAAASALTTSWDQLSKTLTVSGGITVAQTAAQFQADSQVAIRAGLTAAGFTTAGVAGLMVAVGASSTSTTIMTNVNGKSLELSTGNGVAAVAKNAMVVDQKNGNLTITLSDTTANSNTAAKIQAAIQNLGLIKASTGDVDFSKYQITSEGSWDTTAVGENIVKRNTSLVGGTQAVEGDYSFDITKAFEVGDIVNIKGEEFTAVASGAIGSKNQFDVAGGDINNQAISLRNAIGLNSALSATYTTTGSGATIKMTELQATGVDMVATDQKVTATGTAGQYSVDISTLLVDGAAFELDGEKITVSDDVANTGYANGTAFKETADVATQTAAIANAINTNTTLNKNYTASVDSTSGALVLTQTAVGASSTGPAVKTLSTDKGNFEASLQIGANTGQTMTVSIGDMRSVALGISGTEASAEITASDGVTKATLTAVTTASNGSDNNNVEYSLDISTAAKATAAISIIDDATAKVSAERSNLGAIQNRLEHTINNLGTSSQNVTTAEANIRDVDMAAEMTDFQKNNILQQAAQSMLAQANQQGQGVLKLLQ